LQSIWSPTSKESGSIGSSETRLCASLSTLALPAVGKIPPAPTATLVPSVGISPTDPQDASPDDIFPIITKLKAEAWEIAPSDTDILDKFNDILVGLREGFHCGLENFSLSCTSVPPNHYTSQKDKEFVIKKHAKEIALGRLLHGYDPHDLFSLIRHFHTIPLAVIDQGGSKYCIIVNHSYPKNKNCIDLKTLPHDAAQNYIINPTKTSINTIVDSKKFQCAWGSFSECFLLVANAPERIQAAVFDVDLAFHNIPLYPSAHCFLAIMIKGLIHLNHILNFGTSPSPAIFGRVADAMIKILLSRGIKAVIKWVDDFIFLHYPSHHLSNGLYKFTYSLALVWSIVEELE
jgi:hypothetical protein